MPPMAFFNMFTFHPVLINGIRAGYRACVCSGQAKQLLDQCHLPRYYFACGFKAIDIDAAGHS